MNASLLLARQTRREALKQIGAAVMLTSLPLGLHGQNAPVRLRANREKFLKLIPREAQILEALGDALLPGAADAGIAYYVDRQLASDEPLLMLRYLDYPGEFLSFYRKGLSALEALSRRRHQRGFADLTGPEQTEMVREISRGNPDQWNGPPAAPLFYFATRNDAVDVYYGTVDGFNKLGVPYMPHIEPKEPW